MLTRIILIGVGGGIGSVLRYLTNVAFQGTPANGFPLATLLINVAGCAAIGFLMGLFAAPGGLGPDLRLALTVGVLGGFTTFSTFGWETFALVRNGQIAAAVLYAGLTNLLGLLAVWPAYLGGLRLAER